MDVQGSVRLNTLRSLPSEVVAEQGFMPAALWRFYAGRELLPQNPHSCMAPEWPWAREKSARALEGKSEAAAVGLGVRVRVSGPPAAHTHRAGSSWGRGDSWVRSFFSSQQGSSWTRTLRQLCGKGYQLLLQVIGTSKAGARGTRRGCLVVFVSLCCVQLHLPHRWLC